MEFVHKLYARLARIYRNRRTKAYLHRFEGVQSIIDFGGTEAFWTGRRNGWRVTTLNLTSEAGVTGSGCAAPFRSQSCDLAFSNSAIEHVGVREQQRLFAAEMLRVGRQVYCQTPNRWFPFEVHYVCMFLHWYPPLLRNYYLARYLTGWGWLYKPNRERVAQYARSVNLLTAKELTAMFPGCRIEREKALGWTKSLIITGKSVRVA